MKFTKVKDWQEYKDNWAALNECIWDTIMDAGVAIIMLTILVVLLIPALLVAALGYAPEEVDDE